MKKLSKLSLVAALAIASTLQAAGLTTASISAKDSSLKVTIGKSGNKKTLFTLTAKDLGAISAKTIAIALDPKSGMMTLTDPLTKKVIISKNIDKKLFAKDMKKSITMIAAYAKSTLSLQLSMDGKAQEAIKLSKDAKSLLDGNWSIKLTDGKLILAKQTIKLSSIIHALLGCTKTSCKVHHKNAKAIAANNVDYKASLKKVA